MLRAGAILSDRAAGHELCFASSQPCFASSQPSQWLCFLLIKPVNRHTARYCCWFWYTYADVNIRQTEDSSDLDFNDAIQALYSCVCFKRCMRGVIGGLGKTMASPKLQDDHDQLHSIPCQHRSEMRVSGSVETSNI